MKETQFTSAEGRIMFALGKIDAKLSLILCKTSSKPQDSIPEKLIRYARQFSEVAQSIISAIPYILQWSMWIGSFLVAFWKWLLPFVKPWFGF